MKMRGDVICQSNRYSFITRFCVYALFSWAVIFSSTAEARDWLRNCWRGLLTLAGESALSEPVITGPLGISEHEHNLYSTLPFATQIEIVTKSNERVRGLVSDIRFQSMEILTQSGARSFALNTVETFRVLPEAEQVAIPQSENSERLNHNRQSFHNRLRYVEFAELSEKIWNQVRSSLHAELEPFRNLSRAQQERYLDKVGEELDRLIQQRFGINQIGIHYNLHGGNGFEYVDGGGILATHGNIMLHIAMSDRDFGAFSNITRNGNPTVFYYPSSALPFSRFIRRQENHSTRSQTGGTYVILFDVEAVRRSGRAMPTQSIDGSAFSFDTRAGNVGIPVSNFIVPPLRIQTNIEGHLGLNRPLTREESHLATFRHLLELLNHERMEELRLR